MDLPTFLLLYKEANTLRTLPLTTRNLTLNPTFNPTIIAINNNRAPTNTTNDDSTPNHTLTSPTTTKQSPASSLTTSTSSNNPVNPYAKERSRPLFTPPNRVRPSPSSTMTTTATNTTLTPQSTLQPTPTTQQQWGRIRGPITSHPQSQTRQPLPPPPPPTTKPPAIGVRHSHCQEAMASPRASVLVYFECSDVVVRAEEQSSERARRRDHPLPEGAGFDPQRRTISKAKTNMTHTRGAVLLSGVPHSHQPRRSSHRPLSGFHHHCGSSTGQGVRVRTTLRTAAVAFSGLNWRPLVASIQ